MTNAIQPDHAEEDWNEVRYLDSGRCLFPNHTLNEKRISFTCELWLYHQEQCAEEIGALFYA